MLQPELKIPPSVRVVVRAAQNKNPRNVDIRNITYHSP